MSSFGLNSSVSAYFSKFTILEILDLSNNNLSGFIPDFLAEMPKLKILNLSGNNFTGPIPQKLLNKAKSGLQLRVDESESAGTPDKSGNKSNNIVILMAVCMTVSILVVLASLILMAVCMTVSILVVLASLISVWFNSSAGPRSAAHNLRIQNSFVRIFTSFHR